MLWNKGIAGQLEGKERKIVAWVFTSIFILFYFSLGKGKESVFGLERRGKERRGEERREKKREGRKEEKRRGEERRGKDKEEKRRGKGKKR